MSLHLSSFTGISRQQAINKVTRQWIQPHHNCVDVGAHKGQMLKLFARHAPHGIHYAIEPVPELMQHLKKELDKYRNIKFIEKALGSTNNHDSFMYVLNKPALSGLRKRPLPRYAQAINILVETTTLTELLPQDYHMDVLKIDVCGGEQQVLEGGLSKLREDRPLILFRHFHKELTCYDSNPAATYQLLREKLGYQIYLPKSYLNRHAPLDQRDFENIFWKGDDKYFVAIP